MGLGIFQRLHVVINLHRNHPRDTRQIAADHQHHAEFPHGVGEGHYTRGEKTGPRQRQDYTEKGIQWRGSQGRGDFKRTVADGLEGVLQRLDHEGQGIKYRGEHQAPEGEGQRADTQYPGEMPEGAIRPHHQQQVKAQHRRRQNQGQGNHRADRPLPPGTAAHQPPGDGRADQQQDGGDDARQLDGKPNGLKVAA